ncbi:unnamed protein product [Diamesa hyperborea]
MTMDIAANGTTISQQLNCMDLKMPSPKINSDEDHATKMPIKRSFDVAFLMLPDEKLKQKEKDKQIRMQNALENNMTLAYPLSELSVRSDLLNRNHNFNQIQSRANKVFIHSDYTSVFKSNEDRYSASSLNSTTSSEKSDDTIDNEIPRSAFSKVSQIINVDSPVPPMSPDQLSCSSASPPISYSPPTTNFRPEYPSFINSSAFQAINQPQGYSPQNKQKHYYRGSPLNNNNHGSNNNNNNNNSNNNGEPPCQGYLQAFQFGGGSPHAAHAFMSQPEQFMRNPAAAILSTLLPTSLGALSLPAQNVCAKCNISFRMTSDLVYHMRSHHKNEYTTDHNRRKREEKLKCPVCCESFRERHHLTRHMTAHQDKEGDLLEHEIAEYHSRRNK